MAYYRPVRFHWCSGVIGPAIGVRKDYVIFHGALRIEDGCMCLQRFPGEPETNPHVRSDFARSLIELGHNLSEVQNHHILLPVVVNRKI